MNTNDKTPVNDCGCDSAGCSTSSIGRREFIKAGSLTSTVLRAANFGILIDSPELPTENQVLVAR